MKTENTFVSFSKRFHFVEPGLKQDLENNLQTKTRIVQMAQRSVESLCVSLKWRLLPHKLVVFRLSLSRGVVPLCLDASPSRITRLCSINLIGNASLQQCVFLSHRDAKCKLQTETYFKWQMWGENWKEMLKIFFLTPYKQLLLFSGARIFLFVVVILKNHLFWRKPPKPIRSRFLGCLKFSQQTWNKILTLLCFIQFYIFLSSEPW